MASMYELRVSRGLAVKGYITVTAMFVNLQFLSLYQHLKESQDPTTSTWPGTHLRPQMAC